MSSVIELQKVSKRYRRGSEVITAVQDVSFAVNEGEFVSVVGPSGSGKSTLLHLIGCVDRPDDGSVRIDAEETSGLGDRRLTAVRAKKVGFVFQQFFLLPTLTALENVQLPALFGSNGKAQSRAGELLTRMGLEHRTRHFPGQLSGGEMQRVAIARALVNRPRILLADEPTGNLDSANAQSIMELFRSLNAEGLTVLMVTHNLDLASETPRIVHLHDGRVVGDDHHSVRSPVTDRS